MIDFTLEMPRPEAMNTVAEGGALLSALRANSPAIALILINKIRDRTPRDTGALREDEDWQAYTDPVTGARVVNLVRFFTNSDAQLTEWGRVYAQYQEGPPLGVSTRTNGPHQMFFAVSTEDLGDIQTWAQATLDAAVESLVAAFPIEYFGTGL